MTNHAWGESFRVCGCREMSIMHQRAGTTAASATIAERAADGDGLNASV